MNFSLVPTPTSPIPSRPSMRNWTATQSLTITSLGSNQYQIPVGLLSGGSHTIAIHLAASSSYAAAAATVSLAVQKASATIAVAGSPLSVSYGVGLPCRTRLYRAKRHGICLSNR